MQIQGTIIPLTWESEFFGFDHGRLVLGEGTSLSHSEMDQYPLLQAKAAAEDYTAITWLNQLGFQLAEGEATLTMSLDNTERQPGIRVARPQQIPELRQAACREIVYSRFRQPWYRTDQSQQFYAQWIENAVNGQFDDQCLVACGAQGEIFGFASVRAKGEEARLGLLAVALDQQGQGVGQRLLLAAADWGRVRGAKRLAITTQLSNVIAMRLYLRNGARLENTAYWFYRSADDSL